MYVASVDRSLGESEWRPFVEAQGFGHLVAPGRGLDYPVVVPTQFVLSGDEVLTHFAGPNPVFAALRSRPRAVLAIGGDWAFIPSDWKAIDEEDPAMGIPTTYYAEVQLRGRTQVRHEPSEVAEVLRRQLAVIQPDTPVADPEEAHWSKFARHQGRRPHRRGRRGEIRSTAEMSTRPTETQSSRSSVPDAPRVTWPRPTTSPDVSR